MPKRSALAVSSCRKVKQMGRPKRRHTTPKQSSDACLYDSGCTKQAKERPVKQRTTKVADRIIYESDSSDEDRADPSRCNARGPLSKKSCAYRIHHLGPHEFECPSKDEKQLGGQDGSSSICPICMSPPVNGVVTQCRHVFCRA